MTSRRTYLLNLALGALLLAAIRIPGARGQASETGALQILQHLYMSNGQPIQDLIVDAEVSKHIGSHASGHMQLVSHDKIFFKQPNRLREDSTFIDPGTSNDGVVRTIVRDGRMAWEFISASPKPIKSALDPPVGSVMLPCLLQHYAQDTDKEYSVTGHERIGSHETEVIKIGIPDNPADVVTVWVDTQRWVPLKMEHATPVKDSKTPSVQRIVYKDVRQTADGRYFPLHLEISRDDSLGTLVVYKAVSVNTGLADSLFLPMAKFMRPAGHP